MGDDLEAAIALHQHGNIEQAARIYQNILAREPHHPDALHLLGLAAYQKKDPHRAIDLLSQAIASGRWPYSWSAWPILLWVIASSGLSCKAAA